MKSMKELPTDSGSYALFLRLSSDYDIPIGRLGSAYFKDGDYVYFGSAHGPGGLKARLRRHLLGKGKHHWHIDYLREFATVVGYIFYVDHSPPQSKMPIECLWTQTIMEEIQTQFPMAGFGSSDCNSGCGTHLLCIPIITKAKLDRYQNVLAKSIGISAEKLVSRII